MIIKSYSDRLKFLLVSEPPSRLFSVQYTAFLVKEKLVFVLHQITYPFSLQGLRPCSFVAARVKILILVKVEPYNPGPSYSNPIKLILLFLKIFISLRHRIQYLQYYGRLTILTKLQIYLIY